MLTGFTPEITDVTKNDGLSDKDRLISWASQTFDFLFENPVIARISILNDMQNYSANCNSVYTQKGFAFAVRNNQKEETKRLLVFILVSAMQAAFLAGDSVKDILGYDLYSRTKRELFISDTVTMLLKDTDRRTLQMKDNPKIWLLLPMRCLLFIAAFLFCSLITRKNLTEITHWCSILASMINLVTIVILWIICRRGKTTYREMIRYKKQPKNFLYGFVFIAIMLLTGIGGMYFAGALCYGEFPYLAPMMIAPIPPYLAVLNILILPLTTTIAEDGLYLGYMDLFPISSEKLHFLYYDKPLDIEYGNNDTNCHNFLKHFSEQPSICFAGNIP